MTRMKRYKPFKEIIQKPPVIIFIIIFSLFIPLLESCFSGTLWGLKWESPLFMDKLADNLKLFKLILVVLGVLLLVANHQSLKNTINKPILRYGFLGVGYLVAAVQIPLLLLGVLFDGASEPDYVNKHTEKKFNSQTIYVYTQDSGAIGNSYLYFYLKCQLPFNRYELKLIKKMDWMSDYDFEVQESNLVVFENDNGRQFHTVDMGSLSCRKND